MSVMSILRDSRNKELLAAAVKNPRSETRFQLVLNEWGRSPQLLGVAVDLAIRAELARRFGLPFQARSVRRALLVFGTFVGGEASDPEMLEIAVAGQDALLRVNDWVASGSGAITAEIAEDLLRLAGFEAYGRSRAVQSLQLAPPLESAAPYLLSALQIVPWSSLIGAEVVLNPTFGEGSRLAGGADADLFRDGSIIDIKAVKTVQVPTDTVRQLAAYGVLARRFGVDGASGNVHSVGIYHVRSGNLLEWPLDDCFHEGGSEALLELPCRVST